MLITLLIPEGMTQKSDQGWIGGIQYRPLIPTVITTREFPAVQNGGFSSQMSGRLGHSIGVLVRYNFSRHFALEFGLSQTRRNHSLQASHSDSGWVDKSRFGIVNYETPLQGLYYVRLGENLYTNILAGISINFFPSDVESFGQENLLYQRSYRREWVTLSVVLNIGLEYRTEKSGYFYLGASLNRPTQFIYSTFYYQSPNLSLLASSPLQGMYTALDFRYFIPPSKKDKQERKK